VDTALPAVEEGIGGVILFGNVAPRNLAQQLASLRSQAPDGIAPLIMTDEEGGGIQRMANLVGAMPWPRAMAATLTTDGVMRLGETAGHNLIGNGVSVDLAPVLDLANGPGPDASHPDGPRSFSANPSVATAYGLAFARGLAAAGVLPVIKHFPGEGQATANTDDSPASTPPLRTLLTSDLVPFKASIQANLPAVMVGNATVPGLTMGPTSLSPAAIEGLLRGQLGFDGLILTDSLSAGAISSLGLDVPHAAVQAVAAGADMVLYDPLRSRVKSGEVVNQLVAAVSEGVLPQPRLDDAVIHVLRAKGVRLC
jgi:beta-N-acetylhexosaminidase